MLRVGKVRSGGHAYYLEVAGDATRPGIEPPGRWMGRGPGVLGLGGMVDGADLETVLAGIHPGSGQALGPSRQRVRVAAFDLTFCAPKSVSILHGLSDPAVTREVRAGHEAAVVSALDYVERHAMAVRRIDAASGARVPVTTDAVAAGFVHRTSRALDPHLHTHVVVANVGVDAAGAWSALDGRGVYAHAPAASALYHAQLRHELTARLGVAWGPLDRGRGDVVGIGLEARRAFSQRSAAIAAHLVERGMDSPRAAAIAAHATRAPKDVTASVEDLRPRWQARAAEVGLGPVRLDAVLGRVPARVAGDRDLEASGDFLRGALGARGTVTRRDVVRAWCAALPAGAQAGAVEAAADRWLGTLEPAAPTSRPDRPGVGERRYLVEALQLERSLRARGMERGLESRRGLGRGLGHADGRGLGRGPDTGLDFGFG